MAVKIQSVKWNSIEGYTPPLASGRAIEAGHPESLGRNCFLPKGAEARVRSVLTLTPTRIR